MVRGDGSGEDRYPTELRDFLGNRDWRSLLPPFLRERALGVLVALIAVFVVYKVLILSCLAYYEKQGRIAAAIEAEGIAEAKGITELNKALAGSGGKVMVKLKIAEALEGKKIVLLPMSGAGMDIKTTNINRLLETYGLQAVTRQAEDQK